mgnify:CR=1 FL=1
MLYASYQNIEDVIIRKNKKNLGTVRHIYEALSLVKAEHLPEEKTSSGTAATAFHKEDPPLLEPFLYMRLYPSCLGQYSSFSAFHDINKNPAYFWG